MHGRHGNGDCEAYVKEPEDEEFQDGLDRLQESPANVSDALRHRISDWVAQNEECRRLTDEAIAHGAIELPRAAQSVRLSLAMDDNSIFRHLARVKSGACGLRSSQHDVAGALREAVSILKIGSILMHAECLIVDYLIAHAILGFGVDVTYRVASGAGVSDEQAQSAIASLAAAKVTNEDFKQAHRVEFCRWFLPSIAAIPSDADGRTLAACHVLGDRSSDFKPNEKQLSEYRRSVQQIATLLEGHPNPLDKEATIRLAGQLHARFFDELDKPVPQRNRNLFDSLKKELSAWPAEVEPDIWIVSALNEKDNPSPLRKLTAQDLKQAHDKLCTVDNVLGKRMIVERSSIMYAHIMELHQARLESRRIRIALRIYEKKHGGLPEKLDALVDDALLPEVPLDPFDGKPFRYSAERRVIWSVGQDGTNTGIIQK
jgi:hypothetical protein